MRVLYILLLLVMILVVIRRFFMVIEPPPVIDTKAIPVAETKSAVRLEQENATQQGGLQVNKTDSQPPNTTYTLPKCVTDIEHFDEAYFNALQSNLLAFKDSTIAEQQLGYTLFSQPLEGQTRLGLLMQYHLQHPNEPLALMELLSLCSINYQPCSDELIQRALNANRDNGAAWLYAAMISIQQRDDDRAGQFINELAKTSVYNEGYAPRIKLFLRAMEGTETADFSKNVITAIGIEAAKATNYSALVNWCNTVDAGSVNASSCLRLGRNLATRSKLIIGQLIGLGLQKIIYQAEGNSASLVELETQQQKLLAVVQSSANNQAASVMFSNEQLMRNWLDNLENVGEFAAFTLLAKDVEHYLQREASICVDP